MRDKEEVRVSVPRLWNVVCKDVGPRMECLGSTVLPYAKARGAAGCEGKGTADIGRASLVGPDFLHSEVWTFLQWEPQRDFKRG